MCTWRFWQIDLRVQLPYYADWLVWCLCIPMDQSLMNNNTWLCVMLNRDLKYLYLVCARIGTNWIQIECVSARCKLLMGGMLSLGGESHVPPTLPAHMALLKKWWLGLGHYDQGCFCMYQNLLISVTCDAQSLTNSKIDTVLHTHISLLQTGGLKDPLLSSSHFSTLITSPQLEAIFPLASHSLIPPFYLSTW